MKKKSFLKITALLLSLLLLGACAPAARAPVSEPSALPELVLLTPTPSPETAEEPSAPEPTATAEPTPEPTATPAPTATPLPIDEDGVYTHRDDVALYLHVFGHLPSNFITKKEAQALGWPGGSLEPYAPGRCIGGDRFGNYEGLLPDGHNYRECDIDTLGAKSRGAKRIIFSDDGLIYYTDDHYDSFTLLYGEE